MSITPQLIPSTHFHQGIWLLSVERPSWYYFERRKGRHARVFTRPSFSRNVDGPLRELVRFLHERGIATTPSCSGHHLDRHELEVVHTDLTRDRDAIRNGGLELIDVETGQSRIFRDRDYELPWGAADFVARVMRHQQHGALGMALNRYPGASERILRSRIFGAHFELHKGMIFVFTSADTDHGITVIWRRITRLVKAAIESEGAH